MANREQRRAAARRKRASSKRRRDTEPDQSSEAQNLAMRRLFESVLGPDHPGLVEDRDEAGKIIPGWFHVRGKSYEDAIKKLDEMSTSPK